MTSRGTKNSLVKVAVLLPVHNLMYNPSTRFPMMQQRPLCPEMRMSPSQLGLLNMFCTDG